MSETIHIDQHMVTLPLHLNPAELLQQVKSGVKVGQAKFTSSLLIRYHPDVSATTPGQVRFSLCGAQTNDSLIIAAGQPSTATPLWKTKTLLLSRRYLSTKEWYCPSDQCQWVCSDAVQSRFSITCTIKAVTVTNEKVEETQPPPPSLVKTHAVVGPRLAGFSLSYYGKDYPLTNPYGGQVINIDLARSKGRTTTARHVVTPEDKDYIVVRYGWNTFSYVYNSANQYISWSNNSHVIRTYDHPSHSNAGDPPSFWASWARLRGSTSWWCETQPIKYYPSGGTFTPLYRPYAILFLYYDYGDVDVFDPDFKLSPEVLPSACQPTLGPDLPEGNCILLTLNGMAPYLMASDEWNPDYNEQFMCLNKQLTDWPCDFGKQHVNKTSYQPSYDETKEE